MNVAAPGTDGAFESRLSAGFLTLCFCQTVSHQSEIEGNASVADPATKKHHRL